MRVTELRFELNTSRGTIRWGSALIRAVDDVTLEVGGGGISRAAGYVRIRKINTTELDGWA